MKKLIALFIFFLIPLKAQAFGINDYKIDIDVLENGDMHVIEKIYLNGEFNGYERIIDYINPTAIPFDGTIDSFYGSDIYNADSIEIISVGTMNNNEELIKSSLIMGISNDIKDVYRLTSTNTGTKIKIYNPSTRERRWFYIEYKVKNIVVKHNDVSEVAWNIFSNLQNESIGEMKINVNIKNNKNELQVWARGPLHGFSEIIDKNNLYFEIEGLKKNVPLSIRFIFDKEAINTNKTTSVEALPKILEVEKKYLDEANEIRENEILKEEIRKKFSTIMDIVRVILGLLLLNLIRKTYIEHDKEYNSTFQTKYFRDIPSDYSPSVVGYLMNKNIGTAEFSAVIMDLIIRKILIFEEIKKKEFVFKKNYVVRTGNSVVLKTGEKKEIKNSEIEILQLLFDTISKSDQFKMEEINKYAKKNYDSFLKKYNSFLTTAKTEANDFKFFEEKGRIKAKNILFSVFVLFISIVGFASYSRIILIPILVAILAIASIIYFALFEKRTEFGNDQYCKWNGLKNFINDFGNFNERELPQIVLWEKYLVYAVVFGNAKKLAKTMEVKFKEINQINSNVFIDLVYLNTITNLNRNISSGINSAVSTANQIQSSKRSSNGGGGGFSGGGGSFGGGGGGGRF